MEQFTIALGVLLTLSVLSIIWRDNPFYKGAEAVIIGFSAGHLMAVFFARAWQLGFVPLGNQFALLFTTPLEGDKLLSLILLGVGLLLILCMTLLKTNQLVNTVLSPLAFLAIVAALFMLLPMFIPVLLGLLFYSRFVRPVAWMVRLPISFFFGFAGSLSVVMALDASIWRQVAATVQTLFSFSTSYQTLGGMVQVPAVNLDGILIVAGTICALVYFYMTREHRGWIGGAAGVGRYFIMIALGAKFGSVCISRLSLLYERLLFLYNAGGYFINSLFS
jgi:hypothetical protein